jgi:hypothetical protein
MPLLLGTDDGLYTYDTADGTTSRRWPREVEVLQLESTPDGDAVNAATADGVYRVGDDDVRSSGLRGERVVSIHETATRAVYAGTRPAHVYTVVDDGDTWERVESFEAIPGKEDWTQNYMGPAQVRDIRSHANAPWKLFVAVETDGVYVSPDAGRTWEYRGRGLDNDPHGIRLLDRDSVIATCGRGLYRTDDAGALWYRLDTHQQYFWYQYFREGIAHDGVYYTSVVDRSKVRHQDVDDGLILTSTDGGRSFEDHELPGAGEDYVSAWATNGDHVFGGTVHGSLLRGPDEWERVGTVDSTVRSMAVL